MLSCLCHLVASFDAWTDNVHMSEESSPDALHHEPVVAESERVVRTANAYGQCRLAMLGILLLPCTSVALQHYGILAPWMHLIAGWQESQYHKHGALVYAFS